MQALKREPKTCWIAGAIAPAISYVGRLSPVAGSRALCRLAMQAKEHKAKLEQQPLGAGGASRAEKIFSASFAT